MKKFKIFVPITLILLGMLNVGEICADEQWIADEIFMQMSEMRKEIGQLKQRVAQLEQIVSESKPKQTPILLNETETMTLGNTKAEIAIVEFSDYECPYCGKHYKNILPKLRERYIDKGIVKYVMKDFPLEFHAHAKKASLSVRCAGEQGQYWVMHNTIFDVHGQITDQLIDDVIKQLKLNSQTFKQCLDNPAQLASIEKDMALGASLGVNGTPAFLVGRVKDNQLINYKRLDGVQSFETFVGIIDSFKKQ